MNAKRSTKAATPVTTKLFVLDTNGLMHHPNTLYRP